MATKEVMVSAPVLVILYDRTFVAGSFREAWRRRWRVMQCLAEHLDLAARSRWWIVLRRTGWDGGVRDCSVVAGLFCHPISGDRDLPASFDLAEPVGLWLRGSTGSRWLLADRAQCGPGAGAGGRIWLRCARLLRKAGFPRRLVFFVIARPQFEASFRVATETIAEHRMYLPLAAIVVAVVWVFFRGWGRRSLALFALLAGALTVLTWRRNLDYRSNLALWGDTVAKQPNNSLAHFNLGVALALDGKLKAADASSTGKRSASNPIIPRPCSIWGMDW